MMTDDREINALFEEMMYGSSETLSSIVYGYGRIGTGGQQVVRGMIERLREPGRMERLQIRERRTAGHFEMVIVYAPWEPHWSAEGFLPFIIGRHDSRLQLLGYVLPFNPVIPILTAEDREHAFSLAKYWVAWIQAYKKGQTLSKPQ
jgi:hypothetical protein